MSTTMADALSWKLADVSSVMAAAPSGHESLTHDSGAGK